jgi:hypothetical protein
MERSVIVKTRKSERNIQRERGADFREGRRLLCMLR